MPLGTLGNLAWFRCRNCGLDQYSEEPEDNCEFEDLEGWLTGSTAMRPTDKQRQRLEPIFFLSDGSPVKLGDVLWHPDERKVGWCCIANFPPRFPGAPSVTVNSPNGAVPHVLISELRRRPPPPPKRCRTCGQLLPEDHND